MFNISLQLMFLLRPCLADFVTYYISVQTCNGEDSHPHPPVWYEAKQVHHLHHPLIKKTSMCCIFILGALQSEPPFTVKENQSFIHENS